MMPTNNKRQLTKGLILLTAAILLAACVNNEPLRFDPGTPAEIIAEQPKNEVIVFEAESPQIYIVQEGDTLWDISSTFLRDPWHWPEIWFKNKQVENPHLIFPGDVLTIIYVGGDRRITIEKRGTDGKIIPTPPKVNLNPYGLNIVKLSPKIRTRSIEASIPSIPIDSIRHLLARPLLIDKDELERAAYVVSSIDQHLVNSTNDTLYVRRLDTTLGGGRYKIFRPNKELIDPVTNELLGYEALYIGDVKLLKRGDPASVKVTNSEREILRGDRILPIDESPFERDFFPRPPKGQIRGEIISLLGAISQLGQYQTIALNLGHRDGIEIGNILRIKRSGKVVYDAEQNSMVKLPDEKLGLVMIIRSFEKMSYALIMEADFPVHIEDYVETP